MMYYFCTYFDVHYLHRGLVLYESLRRHCHSFQLWVLCMDSPCYDILSQMNLTDVHPITLSEFEKGDNKLLKAKQNRTRVEYYFTCTPSLPLFILNNFPQVDIITYLDADLFFFTHLSPVYEEIDGHSVAIIPHRFPPKLRRLENRGIYNVGYLAFRRDEYAITCLNWWRERCIEWCYDRDEDGRYADQKYLDEWPSRFENVVVLQHKGANVGPWNISNYRLVADGDTVWIDDQKLIFFHFHGLKQIYGWLYDPNLTVFKAKLPKVMKKKIYAPYINALSNVTQQLSPMLLKTSLPTGLRGQLKNIPIRQGLRNTLDRFVYVCKFIFMRNFILVINERII